MSFPTDTQTEVRRKNQTPEKQHCNPRFLSPDIPEKQFYVIISHFQYLKNYISWVVKEQQSMPFGNCLIERICTSTRSFPLLKGFVNGAAVLLHQEPVPHEYIYQTKPTFTITSRCPPPTRGFVFLLVSLKYETFNTTFISERSLSLSDALQQ